MRVTLVFPVCSRQGGVERVVWEAAQFLAQRHQVTVVSTVAEELPPEVVHVPVSTQGWPPLLAPFGFRRAAAAALRSIGSDMVVSYGAECPAADVYVVNSVHRAWLRVANPVTVHGYQVPGHIRYLMPRHQISLLLERSYYARAKGRLLVPCAEQVTEDLSELYGMAGTPNTVVHNGFSPREFSAERRRALRDTVRGELGYDDGETVLVMVANEWQRKGLAVVLDAMEELSDPAIRLLLVGRTRPDSLVNPRSSWLRSRVLYLEPSNDVGRVHAAADVFVLPTQYEAFCLAIIEALASGLPVITTNVPGAADAVVPGVNGLVLDDPHDARALSALVAEVSDPVRRRTLSDAAPGTVAHLTWDALMKQFEVAIESRG
jgi:UDP-glucose:(heptosyl)LPS alpha-1,3-glucosyltransferase